MKKPHQYSLVRVTEKYKNCFQSAHDKQMPLIKYDMFIFLGEIPNMKGHCIVAAHPNGPIISGWHTENFEEVPKEDL